MIRVDIATKIVAPSTSIWIVFPGRARRLLNLFLGHDVIFLEAPGVGLTPEIANNVAALRQRTRLSAAIAASYRLVDPTPPPSRNLADYKDGPLEDGGQNVLASNLKKMFGRMKKGDLVVVPDRLFAPIHFGEVISDFAAADTISIATFGNELLPVRKVRWLNNGVSRNLIPMDLQQRYLSKPPAISFAARGAQADEFFKFAYPSYILAEKSAVIMDCPRYDERNPRATHEANDLVAYFIAAFSAYEQDRLQEFGSLSMIAAIEQFYDRELVQSFTQNYNSPGKAGLTLRSAILGVFVSSGIAVTLAALAAPEWKAGVEVTNSISPQDDHAKDAGIALDYLFKALGENEISELNKAADAAKKNVGLSTPVEVKVVVP